MQEEKGAEAVKGGWGGRLAVHRGSLWVVEGRAESPRLSVPSTQSVKGGTGSEGYGQEV